MTAPQVRPVESLRSGAHTDHSGRYTTQPYPASWHQPTPDRPRSPIDDAMRAAANHLVPGPEEHR
jgi:hypothetical protein